jgi:hypothetical protein
LWLRVIAANSVTFFPLWPTLLDISEEKRLKCTQITRAAWRKSLQQSSSAVKLKRRKLNFWGTVYSEEHLSRSLSSSYWISHVFHDNADVV